MGKNSQSYTYFCFPTLLNNNALDFFISFPSQGDAIPLQHLHSWEGKTAWGQVLRFWQRHQIDCFDKKFWCDIQWMLFKRHNTLAKPFHFTQIRLLGITVPSAITYLLKQVRSLIPFWFKLYMRSPQSGWHDIEKLLQYQKHAHLPIWQETKTFYISDVSWPAMVLEDNCSLQWHIAVKKLSRQMGLNLWTWFGNSNTFSLLCHLRKYRWRQLDKLISNEKCTSTFQTSAWKYSGLNFPSISFLMKKWQNSCT